MQCSENPPALVQKTINGKGAHAGKFVEPLHHKTLLTTSRTFYSIYFIKIEPDVFTTLANTVIIYLFRSSKVNIYHFPLALSKVNIYHFL